MASLLDLLQAGQLPADADASSTPPSDALAKILAMLKPDANSGTNLPGVDVAPMSIAQPSMPSAAVPAPLKDSAQAAAMPDAPAPPIQAPGAAAAPAQNTATPAAATPAASTSPGGFSGPGDIVKTLAAFLGGLSGSGGIKSALGEYQGLETQNATRAALINRGVSATDADAAMRDPAILQQIAAQAFGGVTPEKLAPGESLIAVDKKGNSRDITPTSVANRAKLEPGQVYNPDGSIGWAPGVLAATRAKMAAEGKTYTAADKTAIDAADQKVAQGGQLQDDLGKALQLSKTAWQGANADIGHELNYLAPGLAPQGAKDADLMTNIVTNSILPALKSIFPTRVTDTDVRLVTKLQGIANQPADVREQIINEAVERSKQLVTQAQAHADELRGGTYYQPGGGGAVTARTEPDAPITKVVGGVQYHQINGKWYQ